MGLAVFAQVGEWLKPTDCKSVPPWRYEGSNPSLCTSDSRDTFRNSDGRVCGIGSVVLDHAQRFENQAAHAGNFGDVCAEDLGAAERCDSFGSRA